MFRVPTYLGPSPLHGTGVFAGADLTAGTVIWEFTPGIDWRISEAAFVRFPEPYRSWLRPYCYVEADGLLVLCGDNARYMNHSFDPNCDDSGTYTVALRDVAAGEELTCDYRSFDLESAQDGLAAWRGEESSSPAAG